MSTDGAVRDSIDRAATTVGSVWPLHSFVTANPLSGFEDEPFHEAVIQGEALFGGRGYPTTDVFRRAWETGQIDPEILQEALAEHGYDDDPETLLEHMDVKTTDTETTGTATERVDEVLTKWLAAFLDEGRAEWPMPNREDGFYGAFHSVARYDSDIPGELSTYPEEPVTAIKEVLREHHEGEWESIFEAQLTALPGWTGLIKQRAEDGDDWQSTYPITLIGYMAARLVLADILNAPIEPADDEPADDTDGVPLPELWLRAWEATYREKLVEPITSASASLAADDDERPAAQLVFCIDTRSEIIRRHIEATGPYETHGYAGFFGVPMRYEGYDDDVTVDACPPILDAKHKIADRPTNGTDTATDDYDRWQALLNGGSTVIKSLKTNAATAFSFVESAGAGYGAALAARTLLPARVYGAVHDADHAPDEHEFCEPTVDYNPDGVSSLREGLTLEEQVEYAATAFELMGWEQFGRLVVFTGHASQTANNPYDSSLDCGACAGNPGGPSARVLATICNDEAVKAELREQGFDIPEDTVFLAGEHNTTTDEVELFASDVPESHEADIEHLRSDLETARQGATAERAQSMGADSDSSVRETERRAADWAETRPEWGLAGNAGFVIGPRALTDGLNLDGRSFLHSYDWATDSDGDALEAIMAGPMVVTQWINCQYYFATVDNAAYGSGSKVTHNPVGNVGVYQGNGGDLLTGLPAQSLLAAADEPYHQPLRLSTVIHAPVERVTEILADNDQLTDLLDNGWLSLTVVDPEQDHAAFEYDGELSWTEVQISEPPAADESTVKVPADDD